MGKPKGGSNINTPLKGQISRYYQRLGGDSVRGSATATAKKFNLKGSNVDLEQQPGATPFWNVLDLAIWQASQLEVDKMNGEARHREPELVEVCKKAWAATPDVKILQAFEMRKDCAAEALETEGWCPNEGKGRGGAKRVHTDASYAELRMLLGIQDS